MSGVPGELVRWGGVPKGDMGARCMGGHDVSGNLSVSVGVYFRQLDSPNPSSEV